MAYDAKIDGIEINNKFFGLWVSKNEDIKKIMKEGVWENNLSNKQRLPSQMAKFHIGDEVFLYQNIEDVKIKNTPFLNFVEPSYQYKENTIVKVKCWGIGKVKKVNENNLEIEWDKEYQTNEWYGYFRQDGVWEFEINDSNNLQQQKYKILYDMAFNAKQQDYKWWFDNGILDRKESINGVSNIQNKGDNKTIKNIILYGSPGVGKTHNTNKLISLLEMEVSDKEIFETIKNNEKNGGVDIDSIKHRIKFVTFHQSFGYEDFIEGFRPNEEGNIELEDGVFKALCQKAQKNLEDSQKPSEAIHKERKFKTILNDFIEEIENILENSGNYFLTENIYIFDIEEDAFRYKGDNWNIHSAGLRMRFDILEKLYFANVKSRQDVKKVDGIGGLAIQHATYFWKFIEKLYTFENQQNVQIEDVDTVEQKNYYLVIDEINRGNISKIFGELITLIEEDKRDTLEVTLPYSKKAFKIPSNLYIIGTMNSTDKSIALIDIALRRRFTFLKMTPKAELIEYSKARLLFEAVNKKITENLGEDFQIGHSYFMKIRNDDDLAFVLEYKIVPLLEEYYYGDVNGLNEVLELL